MNLQAFNSQIDNRNATLSLYEDYYIGCGRQWSLKGQITRSGKYLVDKVDINVPFNDFYRKTQEGMIYDSDLASSSLKDITRKRRWAEANIIDFALLETARAVKGVGNIKYQSETNKRIVDAFSMYMKTNQFQFKLRTISMNLEVFGFQPVLVGAETLEIKNPYEFLQLSKEKWLEYKLISREEIVAFFLNNFEMVIDPQTVLVTYNAIYDENFIEYYINGELVLKYAHYIGFCPIQSIDHVGGSSIPALIEIQDQVNIILTEASETFKAHLNPTTIINDDTLSQQAAAYKSKTGSNIPINKQAGSVFITGKDGNVSLVQWNGLPKGIIEILQQWEGYFSVKRGIKLNQDESYVAESAEAKKENRKVLNSIAEAIREEIEVGVQKIFNVWLGVQGYLPEPMEVIFAPMFEVSKKERAELELLHFGVHQDKQTYLKRVGEFTDEEIEEITEKEAEKENELVQEMQS